MAKHITASMLYDLVQCPHRLTMDSFGRAEERDPISPFVQLLWEKGQTFEQEVIARLGVMFTNLRTCPEPEKLRATMEAMRRGDALIYGGRIAADDLLGEPDLLRQEGKQYVVGDIKSGAGEEGGTEEIAGKPKKHYAVQLALYADTLDRLALSVGRTGFIWDVHGREVVYDLDAPQGPRTPTTLWQEYESCLSLAREILAGREKTRAALSGMCKLCHWRTACRKRLEAMHDLTLIPELGRSKRDVMLPHVGSVKALSTIDLSTLPKIPGVGQATLSRFQARARLQTQTNARPYLKEPLDLPKADVELFLDVETDPMRDICYLHGLVERHGGDNSTERYVAFLAEEPTQEAEERAFDEAWTYVRDREPCMVYYYSHYERTIWRKLQARYAHVASEDEIEAMFAPGVAVDLYGDVVRPKTEWPTHDYSIKSLASCLGFEWRDLEPSGAASVEWYHRWTETANPALRQRILEYNEDDCRAMRVVLEGVRSLAQ